MEDLGQKITDIENSLSNVYRWHEAKMREESCLVQRNFDQKIEKLKADFNSSLQDKVFEWIKEVLKSNEFEKEKWHSKRQETEQNDS